MSRTRSVLALLCALVVVLAALTPTSFAAARPALKQVRYRGLTLRVPAAWPVYRLGAGASTCVRFNRHALYLGRPPRTQACPAVSVGRTEAILVSPGRTAAETAVPAGADTYALARRDLTVTASWGQDPAVVRHALAGAGPAATAPVAHAARRPARVLAHAAVTSSYTGLGFDACSAPSAAQMAAWGQSPYRALGVYIGGANSACAQPNLTADWVQAQSQAGWHLLPTYVGLQAPYNSCGCAAMRATSAAAQGAAEADDAAARAAALGVGRGSPIYFDMEAYAESAGTRSAVLTFLSAWTAELHQDGYVSGVYSSAGSGVADLAASYGSGYLEPDDLWFASWDGSAGTAAAFLPALDWGDHQRVHQYGGSHRARYGGVTLDVDSDYVDAATAAASGSAVSLAAQAAPLPTPLPVRAAHRPRPRPRRAVPRRATPSRRRRAHPAPAPAPPRAATITNGDFVEVGGTGAVYRIAGGAPLFVRYWSDVGGAHGVITVTAAQLAALAPVPADGTVLQTNTGATYVVAGGCALPAGAAAGAAGILIDAWDVQNPSNPAAHLNPTPSDGTVVEGEPSGRFWSFQGGRRTPAPAAAGVPQVTDSGLADWPEAAGAAPAAAPSPAQDGQAGASLSGSGAPNSGSATPGSGSGGQSSGSGGQWWNWGSQGWAWGGWGVGGGAPGWS